MLTNLGISTSLEIWRMAVYILIIWLEDVFFGGVILLNIFLLQVYFSLSRSSLCLLLLHFALSRAVRRVQGAQKVAPNGEG